MIESIFEFWCRHLGCGECGSTFVCVGILYHIFMYGRFLLHFSESPHCAVDLSAAVEYLMTVWAELLFLRLISIVIVIEYTLLMLEIVFFYLESTLPTIIFVNPVYIVNNFSLNKWTVKLWIDFRTQTSRKTMSIITHYIVCV